MIKNVFGMAAFAALVCLMPVTSFASTAGWEFSTVGTEGTNNTWNFGEVFTVNTTITLDFLGYYNPTTGLTQNHEVALYDANGNQLADTQVRSTCDNLTAHFCYDAVAPVTLNAGQTYIVQGLSGVDPYAWNDGGFTVFAPITVLGNNWVQENTMSFNGLGLINDVSDGYWGPNFGWDPVGTPEPGSLMMIGTGLLGLAAFARRKKNA